MLKTMEKPIVYMLVAMTAADGKPTLTLNEWEHSNIECIDYDDIHIHGKHCMPA